MFNNVYDLRELLLRLDMLNIENTSVICIDLQEKIGNYKNDRSKIYVEKEEQIKAVLKEMPTAEQIDKMLKKAKLDINEFYDLYSQDKIRKAVKFAKDLKDRFTVLWLNYDLRGGKYDV